MSQAQAAPITDPSGPGTQAGTGEQEDESIKPTLKYFSTGPFIVKRDFVSPKTKIIGRANFNDMTQSTLQSNPSEINEAGGTGSDENYLQESFAKISSLSKRQLKKFQVKRNSLQKHREIQLLQNQLRDDRNFIYNSQGQFFSMEQGYNFKSPKYNKHQKGLGNNFMLPQSLQDREVIKEIIEQRHQMSNMSGAEAFYMKEAEDKGKQTALSKAVLSNRGSNEKLDLAGTPGSKSHRQTPT
jgi:hypothetical protein